VAIREEAEVQGTMTPPSVDARDDGALVRLALTHKAQGDGAFRVLYERYKDEIHGFLVRLLRDDALAEDVLQETFFRVYRNLERCDTERSFRAWLYQITRNAALDAIRVRKKDVRLEQAKAREASDAPPAADEATRRESVARAQEALDTLPEETRALLIQRHGLGMKLEELAVSFQCTERTVRARLVTAAGLLAQALGRPQGGVS
jgi:RNA polymerase sigma-70 factor (ECF subfamily)